MLLAATAPSVRISQRWGVSSVDRLIFPRNQARRRMVPFIVFLSSATVPQGHVRPIAPEYSVREYQFAPVNFLLIFVKSSRNGGARWMFRRCLAKVRSESEAGDE